MPAKLDLRGEYFERLYVLRDSGERAKDGGIKWVCLCDCGKISLTASKNLVNAVAKSCGCRAREASARSCRKSFMTHGKSKSREHNIWMQMRQRCNNPSDPAFQWYGARGISVCSRWMDFERFLEDMGPCPPGYSIERIDVNGDYCPENCKWIPRNDQSKNRTTTVWITANGVTMTLADWAQKLGVGYRVLFHRYHRGWTHERIVNQPVRRGVASA